jgi:Holliday junction resolvase RusA-like endonuclease
MPITIIVPGEPYPWGVEAFTLGRHAALRDKPRSKEYKRRIIMSARTQYHGPLLEGPLRVDMDFYLTRPKSVTRQFPTGKPDRTNLQKAAEDGLTGLIWKDDAQVVDGRTRKLYAGPEGPHTVITVEEIIP